MVIMQFIGPLRVNYINKMSIMENKEFYRFDKQGTLDKPGIIGRLVRLVLGVWMLYFVYQLILYGDTIIDYYPLRWEWWAALLIAFYVLPPVINIGFTKKWGRKPQLVVIILFILGVIASYLLEGRFWAAPLGYMVLIFLYYFYIHLGLSFFISAIIATPGCEMRSLPHLYTLTTGTATKEHYCPGFIDNIDRWESKTLHKKENI